jgi:hypothetical protein
LLGARVRDVDSNRRRRRTITQLIAQLTTRAWFQFFFLRSSRFDAVGPRVAHTAVSTVTAGTAETLENLVGSGPRRRLDLGPENLWNRNPRQSANEWNDIHDTFTKPLKRSSVWLLFSRFCCGKTNRPTANVASTISNTDATRSVQPSVRSA